MHLLEKTKNGISPRIRGTGQLAGTWRSCNSAVSAGSWYIRGQRKRDLGTYAYSPHNIIIDDES